MNFSKKYLSLFVAAAMTAGSLCTCISASDETAAGDDKIRIVTTIFPEYDWVMNVLGEHAARAEVTMLLDSGVDLHSYQPTADDILTISTCDLFIYVGGESDEWVEDALAEAVNKDMLVINLLDTLGSSVKEEEVVEGMQEVEHDHDHAEGEETDADEHEHEEGKEADADEHEHEEGEEADADEHEHEHEEGEVEYDEHVWLSLQNAALFVERISDAIESIDADNAEAYRSNAEAYIAKLQALDEKYAEAVQDADFHTLLFGDRFPFRYLVDDYSLDYYAAFVGCSAETEASFETIAFLAQKVDELELPAVLTIEGSDHRIAETIVLSTKNKDQKILTMDSMQSTTAKDVQDGAAYLSVMESNLSQLTEALNR